MQAVAFNGTFGGYLKRMSGFVLLGVGLPLVIAMMVFGALKTAGLEPSIIFKENILTALATLRENPTLLLLLILWSFVVLPFSFSWFYHILIRYFVGASRLDRHQLRFTGRMGGLIRIYFIIWGMNILAGLVVAPFAAFPVSAKIFSAMTQAILGATLSHYWLKWGVSHVVVEKSSADLVYRGRWGDIFNIYALYVMPFHIINNLFFAEATPILRFLMLVMGGIFLLYWVMKQMVGFITYGKHPLQWRASIKWPFRLIGFTVIYAVVIFIPIVIFILLVGEAVLDIFVVFPFSTLILAWWIYAIARWTIMAIHYEEIPN
ncbi:hypothetical protein [Entomospira culicis]|uniref:Uncharacterized protein n=1 Tax=Entomospira culicis TaxID=2719989 RepID=A0A968GJF6_9SPIO|nr:hypothetical protein [Entomospira culicis]NIZ19835.1 hypothetical protein [Entomospira culicis]NIZ70049.1 hypothetical protein [Entomospira culicis]WDI37155.1 hypothetical protein PVA46_07490 [Entomospira culicis]WDI38784.1 hypothetical protein PVA47_07500 [Entomospira culicis]